ncbi:hypothetical protein NM688_g7305 [Phlebia brevispora]|uniref:Uncharacterized protein n=1 Tax=Phlebia brevispora TaxID=194682 RepID=A0ACC1S6T9_9APHY|nr:hypothetical protein NM688_g7305 [Phlebia brevispora]
MTQTVTSLTSAQTSQNHPAQLAVQNAQVVSGTASTHRSFREASLSLESEAAGPSHNMHADDIQHTAPSDEDVFSNIQQDQVPLPPSSPTIEPSTVDDNMSEQNLEVEENGSDTASENMNRTPAEIDWSHTSVLSDRCLQHMGLNATSWGGLCCQSCQIAYPPSQMLSHLRTHKEHRDDHLDIDEDEFNAAVYRCHILPELPPAPTTDVPPVAGLAVYDGYMCQHCNTLVTAIDTFRLHYRQMHPGIQRPTAFASCSVQRFNEAGGIHRKWFKVVGDATAQQTEETVFDRALHTIEARLQQSVYDPKAPNDPRLVSPFLNKTGWYTELQGQDYVALSKTTETAKEWPLLQAATRAWIQSVADLRLQVDDVTLKKLNSDDTHTLEHEPFGPLLYPDTMKNYARILECFLAMLLRSQGGYKTPYTRELLEGIDDLHYMLNNPSSDNESDIETLLMMIDVVLRALWLQEWVKSSDHPIADPTLRFVMLKSLNMDGSFAALELVTPLLARIKYLMRTFMLRMLTDVRQPMVYSDIERWSKEDHLCTFYSVCDLQHQVSAIVMKTQKPANLFWKDSEDKMVLMYKGDDIALEAIRAMFVQMEQDALTLFEHEVMLDSQLYVPHSVVREDLTNQRVGYSFLEDERNPFHGHRATLLQHVMQDPVLSRRFCYVQGDDVCWKRTALLQWLMSYAKLSALHLLRIEMLSGGPARGTELTAMQYRSSRGRGVRNLIGIGGHLVLLRTYAKTTGMSGVDRLIPHSIDAFEADLLIQDLALARPFAEFAVQECFPEDATRLNLYQYHLFVHFDKLFDTPTLSKSMATYTLPFLTSKITVHDWRHLAIAFRRVLCPTHIDIYSEEDNVGEDHVAAEQTGHTVRTERLKYAITAEALAGPSEDVLPLFFQASNNWQQTMRVVPGGLELTYLEAKSTHFEALIAEGHFKEYKPRRLASQAASTSSIDVEALADKVATKVLSALEPKLADLLQKMLAQLLPTGAALHTEHATSITESAPVVHAVPVLQHSAPPSPPSPVQRTSVPVSDIEESRALSFNARPSHAASFTQKKTSHESEHVETRHAPLAIHSEPTAAVVCTPSSAWNEAKALAAMQEVLQLPNVTWTCEGQRRAAQAVLEAKHDVVATLATGSGKTMLVILPAVLESRSVTVVVVPLKALMSDYQRRLQEMHISFEEWSVYSQNTRALRGDTNLVLVTIEQARKPSFKAALSELHMRRPVRRIVFDEAHYALTASDYRTSFRYIDELRILPVQFVLMSGTIPPTSMPALHAAFQLTSGTIEVRTKTLRPEIQYVLEPALDDNQAIACRVCKLMQCYTEQFQSHDRGLIYVETKEMLDILQQQCPQLLRYEGGQTMSNESRADAYRAWIQGTCSWMACTIAFCAGIDWKSLIAADATINMP